MPPSRPNSFTINVKNNRIFQENSMPQSTTPTAPATAKFSIVNNLKELVANVNPLPKEANAMKINDRQTGKLKDTYHNNFFTSGEIDPKTGQPSKVPPAPSATSSLTIAEQKANQKIQDRMLTTFKPTTQTFLKRGLKNGTVRFEPNQYGGEFIFTPPVGSDTKLAGRDTSSRVANSTPSNLLRKSDVTKKKK